MTKAIVSRNHLLQKLNELKTCEEYMVRFSKQRKELNIDGVTIQCECSNDFVYEIKSSPIVNLKRILRFLEEQSITIAVDDDGWLYIKEAII
jgi:hypothetical protein